MKHFPFGDEPTMTAPNREKFATYYRDETTALDYARNRYYSSTIARFTTADPYGPSARPGAPQTWNRYTYVGGDPVNRNDPSGLDPEDSALGLLACVWWPWDGSFTWLCGANDGGTKNPAAQNMELMPEIVLGGSSWDDGSMSHRVPLPFAQARAILTAFESLAGLVLNQGEDCNTNVIGKLGAALGFDVTAFATYLQNGATILDGTVSTAPIAGTITSTAAANIIYGSGATVASVFDANQGGLQVNALTSITASYLTVYMRPSSISLDAGGLNAHNLALLFHEALHGYGGSLGGDSYFDSQIQEAFFGAGSAQVGAATANITEYIQTHCFH